MATDASSLVNQAFAPLFSLDGQREWSGDTCVDFVFSIGISIASQSASSSHMTNSEC